MNIKHYVYSVIKGGTRGYTKKTARRLTAGLSQFA